MISQTVNSKGENRKRKKKTCREYVKEKKRILQNRDWSLPRYTLWLIALSVEEGAERGLELPINLRETIY